MTGKESPMHKVLLISGILIFFYSLAAAENIRLKMVVVNPSETETKTTPAKTYLPKGITAEDVVDKGNFRIEYDLEKSLYYAYQEVVLGPKETLTLELAMRDIWVIPGDEIMSLREHTQNILGILKNTDYYAQAKILAETIAARLDRIAEAQGLAATQSPELKISGFEINSTILKEVKKDLGILEDLAIDVGGKTALPAEGLMGESASSNEAVSLEDTGPPDLASLATIKFKIEVSNSLNSPRDIQVKYYLPAEIKTEHVVNSSGLDVAYDYQKSLHYVYKEAVALGPQEKREFVIELKDIWAIPQSQLQILRQRVEELMQDLSGSAYKDSAKSLAEKVTLALDEIEKAQADTAVSVERHIGDYRMSLIKFDNARKDLAKLERLAVQTGGPAGKRAGSGKALREGARKGKILRGAKGMELVGKSIFGGKAPDTATSWKIIYIILAFLGSASLLYIMLQFWQGRIISFDPLTGVYRRDYIISSLKNELTASAKKNYPCSVLLLDIDKFKNLNDTYGHILGDAVIKNFAINLKAGLRKNDLLGRYGGDEFLIILPTTNKEDAKSLAEKIRKIVEENTITVEGKTLKITTSVGIAVYPEDEKTVTNLLIIADKALYKAKAAGGNTISAV